MWRGRKPTTFLPGEFFYRTGSVSVNEDGDIVRGDQMNYYLGAYGSRRTRGEDLLGPDPTGKNKFSPFGPVFRDRGNPDGIADGVIYLLEPADMRGS